MLKNQKFGVEIELTGITRKAAAKVIAKMLNSEASQPQTGCYKTRTIMDILGREWKVMRDSSIEVQTKTNNDYPLDEYKVEVVTPPLQYTDIELLQEIVRELRKAGAIVNSSCGIHIHVDGANHNSQSLRRLVNFITARQDLIYEALEIDSYREKDYCKKLSPELLKTMKKKKELSKSEAEEIWYSPANDGYSSGIRHEHYNATRYHGINLHSYFSKGTVEFRLFNSTLHAGKIKAYIQFCLAVSAWAITSTDKIAFRSITGYTAEQKVTIMKNILTQRLGLYGDEFKTCRLHIMEPLKRLANRNVAA